MTEGISKPARAILEGSADCACLNLRGAARAVTQMYDEILRPSGLKATQFSVLAAVATKGPASMTLISNALVMDRTTLTRNLKPLMDRGLIKSGKGQDRRQHPIEITAKGETLLARALPMWKQAHDQIVDGVGFARWQGMAGLLEETIALSR
jgi:DNA-binding MarR family transcriptional regulator